MLEVESFRFAGRMSVSGRDGEELSLVMRGAATQKGGGASYLTMRAQGLPAFPEVSVVVRGKRAWMDGGGTWTPLPVPPRARSSAVSQFDFTPYVKDVKVESGPVLDSEPTSKIVGVLDTAAFARGMLGQLGSLPGAESALLPELSDVLGDTRMVLYVSETTQLPLRGLVDMAMEVEGERFELHMDFALKGFDKPVRIPVPGV
jgi:hypothetical protein